MEGIKRETQENCSVKLSSFFPHQNLCWPTPFPLSKFNLIQCSLKLNLHQVLQPASLILPWDLSSERWMLQGLTQWPGCHNPCDNEHVRPEAGRTLFLLRVSDSFSSCLHWNFHRSKSKAHSQHIPKTIKGFCNTTTLVTWSLPMKGRSLKIQDKIATNLSVVCKTIIKVYGPHPHKPRCDLHPDWLQLFNLLIISTSDTKGLGH